MGGSVATVGAMTAGAAGVGAATGAGIGFNSGRREHQN